MPAETRPGSYARRICHGAYPVLEYKGSSSLSRPARRKPEFPVYDFMDTVDEDCVLIAGRSIAAAAGPRMRRTIHLTFLHSCSASSSWRKSPMPFLIFARTSALGQVTAIRRLGDIYYIRINR